MSLKSFVAGAAVGGILVFGSLSYHFLRTNRGFEVVPKVSPTFLETYMDVRNFAASDWTRHKPVVAAIVRAKKDSIFEGAAVDTTSQAIKSLLPDVATQ